jgi:Uncharacterized protein conserved in bacteria (DUF2334)
MLFAIRDDDLNYFSDPVMIQRAYAGIWDICPISFSTVPFHACTKSGAIPKKYWQGERTFPIGENKSLVDFIARGIERRQICVTLHGCTHRDEIDGYEFETGDDLFDKIMKGKAYLKTLFGKDIEVFVPPHNRISRKGLDAAVQNRLHIANIVPFRSRYNRSHPSQLIPAIRRKIFSCKHPNRHYPYVLDFGDHKEVECHGLVPRSSLDQLIREFNFCRRHNGIFILAAHHWEYDTPSKTHDKWKLKDVLLCFWDIVLKHSDVCFASLNQVFNF